MTGKHCKLYDENLVRNIMISTGVSIFEYLRGKKGIKMDEICEFVEINADNIIENTIEDMNNSPESPGSHGGGDDEPWSETEGPPP